eukprot:14385533-Ditylum_brightwellii.AAC.1
MEWVEAHQDMKYPEQPFSAPATLNCTVDADASNYMVSDSTASDLSLFYHPQQQFLKWMAWWSPERCKMS